MKKLLIVIVVGLALLVLAAQVRANQRVALVIGNARYAHAPALANPLNDAGDLGAALGRLDFKVTRLDNASYFDMIQGLRSFTRAASTAEVALVFYAGHGIEVDKRNFLIPVDARLQSDREVEFETVSLDLVSRAVEGASGLGLVILDACRDNPFAAAMKRSGAKRSIGRGLARVEPSGETLVAYAAKGGSVAADGAGRNSPYTTALLAHVEEPGLEVGLMFRKVRDAVLRKTNGRQEPFVYGSLSSKGFYFSKAPVATPVAPKVVDTPVVKNAEFLFWESVKESRDPADLEAYLDQFPGGSFASLARNRLKRLSNPQVESKVATEGMEVVLDRKKKVLIQRGLASLKFNPGPADGMFGPMTRDAVRAWQRAKGYGATGKLTKEQADALVAVGEEIKVAVGIFPKPPKPVERSGRTPGSVFRDCPDCPEMVVVPAGSFMMGSPSHEAGRGDDEGPRHLVTISKPFAVGKYEVTIREFRVFIRTTGRDIGADCGFYDSENRKLDGSNYSWFSPGYEQTDLEPVVCVNWHDAQAYVRWLSQKTGKEYRLPSEAEWEYSARGGTRKSRYWGDNESAQCAYANGADKTAKERFSNWTIASWRDGFVNTAPVGSFSANEFGLHDTHGNVWEWVEDFWNDHYRGAPTDGSARINGDSARRIRRGGSWIDEPWYLRSADRDRSLAGDRAHSFGFRVVRTLVP